MGEGIENHRRASALGGALLGSATLAVLLSSLLLVACAEEAVPPGPNRPVHCHPLSDESWCTLPWPSSFYLASDPTTPTGFRVSYPRQVMPMNESGVAVDPTRYNRLDGFPIASQLLAAFREGISATGLPGPEQLAQSLEAQSPIWLIEMSSGERVPFFAEVDANPGRPGEPAGLIIRPQAPLRFSSRYAVALRSSLRSATGEALVPPDGFRRVRDRLPLDERAAAEGARLQEVLDFLASKGLPREELVLAWDFHTASQEAVTGPLRSMVEEALAALPGSGPVVQVTGSVDHEASAEPHLLRQIEATMEVPTFLASDGDDSLLKLDAAGKAQRRGSQRFPFLITVPRCAEQASGPLPVLVYGHGLFGSQRDLLVDYHKMLGDRLCMVVVATDWLGLSQTDLPFLPTRVLLDFSGLPAVTDRLQQAHVNMQTLLRLARQSLAHLPELSLGGKPVVDGKQVYYLGISNGGIQGATLAALTSEVERMALHVPGGWWSMMIQRSSDFVLLAILLEKIYTSSLDRLLLLSLSQHLWDATDPIGFSMHPLQAPLPGRARKRILLQESRGDDQVPNLATRALVRGLGLSGLATLVEPVHGVKELPGPLDSAYVQYDLKLGLPPPGNTPPPKPADEVSPHRQLRELPAAIKQLELFFRSDGRVVSTCTGACDPE